MRLLLDTSAYSAFMRGHAEIRAAVQSNEEIFLNSVIFGELIAGFIKGGRRRKNENELRRFLASPRVGVLDVTEETARKICDHYQFPLACRHTHTDKRYLDCDQYYGARPSPGDD